MNQGKSFLWNDLFHANTVIALLSLTSKRNLNRILVSFIADYDDLCNLAFDAVVNHFKYKSQKVLKQTIFLWALVYLYFHFIIRFSLFIKIIGQRLLADWIGLLENTAQYWRIKQRKPRFLLILTILSLIKKWKFAVKKVIIYRVHQFVKELFPYL